MKIKYLQGTNIKGRSFEQSLADITVFYGRNFSGKTTRLEALTLAMCHQLPGVATRPGDIYELLATGTTMVCYAESDNDEYAGASWEQTRKKVEANFEGSLSAPPLLFNTAEFLDLGPKDRTEFLFRTLPEPDLSELDDGWGVSVGQKLSDVIISKVKNIKLEPHTPEAEAAVNEYAALVANHPQDENGTVQNWLESLVEEVSNAVKESNSSAKVYRQTATGAIALQEDGVSLAHAEEELSKAKSVLAVAVTGEHNALTAFSTAERAVVEARQLIGSSTSVSTDPQAKEKLEAERQDLQTFLAREDVDRKLVGDTEQQVQLAEARAAHNVATLELGKIENEQNKLEALECCPTCKNKGKTWKKAALAELTGRHVKVLADYKNKGHLLELAKEMVAQAILARDKETLMLANIRSSRYRLAEVEAELNKIATATAALAPAAQAQNDLPRLIAEAQEKGVLYQTAKRNRVEFAGKVVTAETVYRNAVASASNLRTAQQAAQKATEKETTAAVGKMVNASLSELLKKCIEASVGPLVDLCNSLCFTILPAPLSFVDGEIRMGGNIGGHSHKTFSGTEKALTYAALSVALAANHSSLRLVVLDELGRLDRENKQKVVDRLAELIQEGKIDQAILVDTEPLRLPKADGVSFENVEVVS